MKVFCCKNQYSYGGGLILVANTVRYKGEGYIEYTRTDAFIKKTKEAFCKAMCNGHPPRSTCTSLGTCKEYDNFVRFLKGE